MTTAAATRARRTSTSGGPSGLSTTSPGPPRGRPTAQLFGCSVATAGDVNGDGYSDVIVGAYHYSSSTGKAYLYLGGPSGLSATSAWTATGEGAGDTFGGSVSTAGDVNGDGYPTSSFGANVGSSFPGKTYLYLGGGGGWGTPSSPADARQSRFPHRSVGAGARAVLPDRAPLAVSLRARARPARVAGGPSQLEFQHGGQSHSDGPVGQQRRLRVQLEPARVPGMACGALEVARPRALPQRQHAVPALRPLVFPTGECPERDGPVGHAGPIPARMRHPRRTLLALFGGQGRHELHAELAGPQPGEPAHGLEYPENFHCWIVYKE